MNKKHLGALTLALVSALLLCSCGNKTAETSSNIPEPESSAAASADESAASSEENANSPEDSVVSANTDSNWELSNYVDDNYEDMDKQYIKYDGTGKYSAMTIEDIDLDYTIVADDEGIAFMLYEKGDSLVHNTLSIQTDYSVSVTIDDKDTVEYSGYMAPDGDRIFLWDDSDQQELLNYFKENKKLSFHIVNENRRLMQYDFSLDTTGFAEAYKQLF